VGAAAYVGKNADDNSRKLAPTTIAELLLSRKPSDTQGLCAAAKGMAHPETRQLIYAELAGSAVTNRSPK